MAHTYKNSKVDLTTTDDTSLYVVPEDTTSIIKSILVSNDDTSNASHVTVTLLNTANDVFSLFKQKNITAKTTEELKFQAENANDLHVVISYLEIT
jgi:hypothetical protein